MPRRKRRPLPKTLQLNVYRRDNWLCYWCKRAVIFSPAFKLLQLDLQSSGFDKVAYYHPHGTRRDAPLLDELGAAIDHVHAFSSGGACSEENFRTSCWKCNVRKNDAAVQKWEQREKRSPIKGKYGEPTHWDGLTSLFILIAERNPSLLTDTERDWLSALKAMRPCSLAD
ncbi:MAG: HNH endonuclease [Acidobacteriaceae bacterium]|nr:HNH endonuclease [Acidobacteriaceae bacterium]